MGDGWRRVQVRQGFIGRDGANPLPGFTIELPDGWTTGEIATGSHSLSGWIAANPLATDDYLPALVFSMTLNDLAERGEDSESNRSVKRMSDGLPLDRRSDVRFPVIDGEQALLHLSKPAAVKRRTPVGIYFERVPGFGLGKKALSLFIEGDSRGFVDQEQLARVLTSARYAELTELPELPSVGAAISRGDWLTSSPNDGPCTFAMKTPPGWEFEQMQGIDTVIGALTNGAVRLQYDFGGFAGLPFSPVRALRNSGAHMSNVFSLSANVDQTVPAHLIWEEPLGADKFWFVCPESSEPHPNAVTGMYVRFSASLPEVCGIWSQEGPPGLSMHASGLNGEQQEIVLAMFRTIRLKDGGGTPG